MTPKDSLINLRDRILQAILEIDVKEYSTEETFQATLIRYLNAANYVDSLISDLDSTPCDEPKSNPVVWQLWHCTDGSHKGYYFIIHIPTLFRSSFKTTIKRARDYFNGKDLRTSLSDYESLTQFRLFVAGSYPYRSDKWQLLSEADTLDNLETNLIQPEKETPKVWQYWKHESDDERRFVIYLPKLHCSSIINNTLEEAQSYFDDYPTLDRLTPDYDTLEELTEWLSRTNFVLVSESDSLDTLEETKQVKNKPKEWQLWESSMGGYIVLNTSALIRSLRVPKARIGKYFSEDENWEDEGPDYLTYEEAKKHLGGYGLSAKLLKESISLRTLQFWAKHHL